MRQYMKRNSLSLFKSTFSRFPNVLRRSCSNPKSKPEEKFITFRIRADWWKYYKTKALIFIALCGSLFVGGTIYYTYKLKRSLATLLPSITPSKDSIVAAFEVGTGVDEFKTKDNAENVERTELEAKLKKILHPEESGEYVVIVGKNGCGKSTVVRKVLSSLSEPKGFVYFDCPVTPKMFSAKLSHLLKHRTPLQVNEGVRRYFEGITKEKREPDMRSEPLSSFSLFEDDLFAAAEAFTSKHKRPMVLVLDSVDILANKSPEFLVYLQDTAKKEADCGNLRIVFITSDGSALPLLMSQSSWSRAKWPPFEIGEISDEDAIAYLIGKDVDKELAERVVKNITGGLFVRLNRFASGHREGMKYDDFSEIMDKSTYVIMTLLKIPVDHDLFKRLVANQRIGTGVALKLGLSEEQLNSLLAKNILAVHPNQTYTFHDRHVSRWFHERNNIENAVKKG